MNLFFNPDIPEILETLISKFKFQVFTACQDRKTNSYVGMYVITNYVCWPGRNRSEGKKCAVFKKWKKCCGLCCRAAYTTKNFFKAQNPLLINKSGFKSRAAYDGARTVHSVDINKISFMIFSCVLISKSLCSNICVFTEKI